MTSWSASRRPIAALGLGLVVALSASGAGLFEGVRVVAAGLYRDGGSWPGGSAPQGSAPQGSAPQGSAPQGSAPQGSAPQGTAAQGSAPQRSAPQGSAPQGSAPQGSAPQGSAPQGSAPQGSAPQGSAPQPAPCSTATPFPVPTSSTSVVQPPPPTSGANTAMRVPLHTVGGKVVDANGREVRFTGVAWFGFETKAFAPHGLWARNWQDMLDQIKAAGF